MATPRLTFLYPHLFRPIRIGESSIQCAIPRGVAAGRSTQGTNKNKSRNYTAIGARRQRAVGRHGKAVQPLPIHAEKGNWHGQTEDLKAIATELSNEKRDRDLRHETAPKMADHGGEESADTSAADSSALEATFKHEPASSEPLSPETEAASRLPGDLDTASGGDGSSRADALAKVTADTVPGSSEEASSLETVLHMPPPETLDEQNAAKPPHLQTPPYVHHFDTYTLVKQVTAGGFTTEQSITTMKAVRGLLAQNLGVAKAGLVSKSDVENESYLFRAACSELRTEVQNNRRKNEETMRRDRTLLQHEVDILNQKLSQDLLTLKDDLKGMFDDRKMAVRMEQRAMESAIQELNYKITVLLNSDSKSEVEGLRWVLTRRSVMGILVMAFMVLTSLRYASYKSHELETQRKAQENQRLQMERDKMSNPHLPPGALGVEEILASN